MTDPWLVLGALILEAAVGYPDALHRRVPHPVTWIGRALSYFGSGARPSARDLRRGLRLYLYACGLLWVWMAAGGLAWPR